MSSIVVIKRRYHWPDGQLNFFYLIFLASSATVLGVSAYLWQVQEQLLLPVPWLFPYWVATTAISLLFLAFLLVLVAQRRLLPGVVIIGAFILFVLWLTGLIQTSLMLWSPTRVNAQCTAQLGSAAYGDNEATYYFLGISNICAIWKAMFAFAIIGTTFLIWLMIISWQTYQEEDDD